MALSAKVLTFARPAAGTTNTVLTGAGFAPTVAIFLQGNPLAAGWRAKLETAIGWAAKAPGDPVTIVATGISQGSNDASASPSARLTTSMLDVRQTDGAGTATSIMGTVTFQSDGLTIDWTNSPYDAEQELCAVLLLGGDARAVAASYTATAAQLATGELMIPTDVRFVANAVMIGASSANAQSLGVMAGPGAHQWALSLADQLGANPTNQYRRLDADRAIHLMHTSTGKTRYAASVVEPRTDGLRMTRLDFQPLVLSAVYGVTGAGTSPVNFNGPTVVANDASGNTYVADTTNNRVMKIGPTGAYVSSFALSGVLALDVDAAGNIYTINVPSPNQIRLAKYNAAFTVQWQVQQAVGVWSPVALATDGISIYLVDRLFNRITQYTVAGAFMRSWGSLGTATSQFTLLDSIATDGTYVYTTEDALGRVQKFTLTGTFVATWGSPGSANGQIGTASLITTDPTTGDVLVSDQQYDRIQRFRPDGTFISTLTATDIGGLSVAPDGTLWTTTKGVDSVTKWAVESSTVTFATLYLSGLTANCGVSAKPISGAPATHTIATGMNSKAALLATHQDTTLATTQDHLRFSVGVSDGTANAAITGEAQDAVSTSNSDDHFSTTMAIVKANNATAAVEASAPATFTAGNLVLTWNPNDAIATQIAWLTFGNTTPLEAQISAQSGLFPSKPGVPTPLSAMLEAVANIPYAVIGNQGNIGTVTIDALSTMEPTGYGFAHVLAATIDAAAGFAPPGVPIPRDLASTIAMAGSLNIVHKLARDSTLQLLIAAVSGMNGGLALPHNLGTTVVAAAEFLAGFHIDMPILRAAGPLDLPGTVNWHINPSAERGLTNWFTEGAGPAITQDASESWDGTYSVKRVTTAASAGQGIMARGVAGLALTGLDANGNTRRVFGQMRVKGDAGSVGALMDLYTRVRYMDNTIVDGEHQQFALTTNWRLITTPGFILDPAKVLNFAETVLVTPAGEVVTVYADGAQIEEDRGRGPTMFTIGSYGRETGYWTGVPHVSMSVRDPIPLLIQGVGRGGDVVIDARMYRMTWDGIPVEDISDTVVSASVSMDAEREVTWAMDAVLTWEGWKRLTPNFDWIAPFMTVTWPDGTTVKSGQLGLYFVVPSEAERNEFDATVKLSCFDPLWLIQRQGFTGPLKVLAGEERVKAVRAILDGAVLTGGDQTGTPSRYAIPGDGKPWKKQREWPARTPRLGLCNDILQSAAFYPLWTTAQGIITSRRMGDARLAQRTPVKAWAANTPGGSFGGSNASGDGGPGGGIGGPGGGPGSPGGPGVWIPRLGSRLSSEVVGAIKTVPKAQDMFDEILMINDDPDGSGIFVGGVVKGPNVDPGDDKRDHDHHRDRERRERHENRDRHQDSHEHNRADRDRDREGRDRQDDSRHRDRNRNRNRDQDQRQVDAERNRQHDDEERQRDRQRQREDERKDRERANQLGGKDRVVFKGKNRRRVKPLYAPYVDDEATAQEIALALADELSSTTQGVELSVLPDPSVNYCRETVVTNIWDALSEPVAVGHFAVKSVKWGFTPQSCLQTLALDFIDPGLVDTQPSNGKG